MTTSRVLLCAIALTAIAALPTRLDAQAFSLDLNAFQLNGNAGGAPVTQTVVLTNHTSGPLTVSFLSNQPWLSAVIIPNPVPGSGSGTITVTAKPGPTHTGNIHRNHHCVGWRDDSDHYGLR